MIKEDGLFNIDKEQLDYALANVDYVNYKSIEKLVEEEDQFEKSMMDFCIESSIKNIYKRLNLNLIEIKFFSGFENFQSHAKEIKQNMTTNLSNNKFSLNITDNDLAKVFNDTLMTNLIADKNTDFLYSQNLIKTIGREFANILVESRKAGLQRFILKQEHDTLNSLYHVFNNSVSPFTGNELIIKLLKMNSFFVDQNILEHANDILNLKMNAYRVFFTSNTAYVIEKPKYYLNSEVRNHTRSKLTTFTIHHEKGPALVFRDGSHFSYYHGKQISNWYWDMKDSQKKMNKILRINNVSIRNMVIDYIGKDKFLSFMNKKVIDEKGNYRVILIEFPTRFPSQKRSCPYLEMKNPSTGETHIEGIDPRIRKVDTALKWRLGLKTYEEEAFAS